MQRFSIIMWSRAREFSLEEMMEISYDVLLTLKNYGEELNPKYLPAKKKSLVKEFNLSKDNVRILLEQNVNQEDGRTFYDLGRHLSFFSSFDDLISNSISIKTGVSNIQFNNTLVVDLPYINFSGLQPRKKDFEELFVSLTKIFQPFWGCVACSKTAELFNYKYFNSDKPLTVHWMNYYDQTTAEKIGLNKILSLSGVKRLENGYFYKLQDEPFDIENLAHLQKQKDIAEHLGL